MFRTVILAALCVVVFSANADARQRQRSYLADPGCNITMPCEGVSVSTRGEMIARHLGFGAAQKVYRSPSQATPRHRSGAAGIGRQRVADYGAAVVAHPAGCPSRAFCGCGAAVRIFGTPVRSLWLAANWLRFPRSVPAAGMVAVRRHHVFVLEAHLGGNTWEVFDANSGRGQTRIHARSIAGYVIVNPRAG